MSKAARQRSARERLAEERRRQAQRQQRVRQLTITVSALVIVALVVVITVFVVNKKDKADKPSYAGPLAPTSRMADGSILMGNANAKLPKLELFEDFQCPICREFENTSGTTIKKLAAQGKANVLYRPLWLFREQQDPIRGNSQRAANAALCAPGDKWVQYHDLIYKHQPEEGSDGFSDDDLIGWAKQLGFATPAFQKCVKGLQKQNQLNQMTNYAEQTRKVSGTPTVYLDGQSLDLNSTLLNPANLQKAILAATPVGVSDSATPAATPSPSASASAKQ